MGLHLIALGSSGLKSLEMLTYACACDALYILDEDLKRIPPETLNVLTVETAEDAESGFLKRYQSLRNAFTEAAAPHPGFHTELLVDHLSVISGERYCVNAIAGQRDRLFSQTLFTLRKSAMDVREGFRGHADIGMFFFADALLRLSEQMTRGEIPDFFRRLQEDIDSDDDAKVLIVGSVYGGTGMSGILSFARFLRGRWPVPKLTIGASLLLPAHDPRNADRYNARAAAALHRYAQDHLMRKSDFDNEGLLDAVYPIRLTENLYAASYMQGGETGEGDLRLKDWLSVHCASQFFSSDFRTGGAQTIGCFFTPRTSHAFSWPCFDDDRAFFLSRFGGLMRAAAVYIYECHPTLTSALKGRSRPPHAYAAFPKAMKKLNGQQRETLAGLLEQLFRFMAQYGRRIRQIQRYLPPPMPGRAGADGFFSEFVLRDLAKLEDPAPGEDQDAVRRRIRDSLPALISGHKDDSFTYKRALSLLSKNMKPDGAGAEALFSAFVSALMTACAGDEQGLHAKTLPQPDSFGRDPNFDLLKIARNLPVSKTAPFSEAPDILAREERLCRLLSLPHELSVRQPEVIEWRALLAMLLLWDGWEARHNLPELTAGPPPEGPGTRAVLSALGTERRGSGLTLFTIEKDVDGMIFEGPVGLLSHRIALLSAADTQKLHCLLPACVRWYHAEQKAFSDPCPLLSETDRARLIHRLRCLQALIERDDLGSPLHFGGSALYAGADAFLGDLQHRNDTWRERFEAEDTRAIHALYIRTLAVYGLGLAGIERQEEELSVHDLKQNPLMNHLIGTQNNGQRPLPQSSLTAGSKPMTSYFYQGRPFAVDSQRYLLIPVNTDGEQETLDLLEKAIEQSFSAAEHRLAAKRFLALANRFTSRSGASRKVVSLLRAWSVRHSRMAEEAEGAEGTE